MGHKKANIDGKGKEKEKDLEKQARKLELVNRRKKRAEAKVEKNACLERLRAKLDEIAESDDFIKVSKYYHTTLFIELKRDEDGYDSRRICCVICSSIIIENESWKPSSISLEKSHVFYKQRLWEYYTCSPCATKGMELCPTSLTSNYKCYLEGVTYREKCLLLFLLFGDEGRDILSVIKCYLVEFLPCLYCLHSYKGSRKKKL